MTSIKAPLLVSFGILLHDGRDIHLEAPQLPETVRNTIGKALYTREEVVLGRPVWRSVRGHRMGYIWHLGSYVAPDGSADCRHRKATAVLDLWSQHQTGKP